jgi:hypothetical protein
MRLLQRQRLILLLTMRRRLEGVLLRFFFSVVSFYAEIPRCWESYWMGSASSLGVLGPSCVIPGIIWLHSGIEAVSDNEFCLLLRFFPKLHLEDPLRLADVNTRSFAEEGVSSTIAVHAPFLSLIMCIGDYTAANSLTYPYKLTLNSTTPLSSTFHSLFRLVNSPTS